MAFGLKRDQSGLAAAVAARGIPGSADYFSYLSAGDIAAQFGPPTGAAAQTLATLQAAGFQGTVDGTGSVVTGSMTPPEISAFFGEDMVNVEQGAAVVAQPARPVSIPDSIGSQVEEVAGLTLQVGVTDSGSVATFPPNEACPEPGNLAATVRAFYNMDTIVEDGSQGQGIRIAMIEINQVSQKALQLYSKCLGIRIAPVTNHLIDQSPGNVFGATAEESTLDVISASFIAPGLSGIDTFQFNPFSSILFPLAAALEASYQPDGPQFISSSIGFCETGISDNDLAISEWLLMSAAATGVTTVASSGDEGSSACAPGNTGQAAQYPASSPYVTAVGGTDFINGPQGEPASESVWNASPGMMNAGGGTTASLLPRPAYQSSLGLPGGRIVPDLAFVATPASFGPIPICTDAGVCSLQVVGGTSATAPAVTAAMGLTLKSLQKSPGAPQRLGALNETLYQLASNPATADTFIDVTTGNNDLYSVGCCSAGPGFDAASGWGSVNFGELLTQYQQIVARAPRN